MTGLMIIGQDPCKAEQVLAILWNCEGFPTLSSDREKVAELFDVPAINSDSEGDNQDNYVLDLLYAWTKKRGENATVEELCTNFANFDASYIGDKLKKELGKICTDHIIGRDGIICPGKKLKMSDIFNFTSSIASMPKKNDPVLLFQHLQLPQKLESKDSMAIFVEKILAKLKPEEMVILENFSFQQLPLQDIASLMQLELSEDEGKAAKILRMLNFNNFGKSYVLWFVAANKILKTIMESDLDMRNVLWQVFEFQPADDDDGKYKFFFPAFAHGNYEDDNVFPHFKNKLLVYFMDWFVGTARHQLHLNFNEGWYRKFGMASQKCNAISFLDLLSDKPNMLYKFVRNSLRLEESCLEATKMVISHIIQKDSTTVTSAPLLLLQNIHVQVIRLLCQKGANMQVVDKCGRNIVFLAAKYLPPDQLQDLLQFLRERNLDHLIFSTNAFRFTAFDVNPKHFIKIGDVSLIQNFAAAGANFKYMDIYGHTCMYFAVRMSKSVEFLETLIECGADWNWNCSSGRNLLHVAAEKGHLDAIRFLARLGCNVNAIDVNGETPLYCAWFSGRDNDVQMVKVLLELGADRNLG